MKLIRFAFPVTFALIVLLSAATDGLAQQIQTSFDRATFPTGQTAPVTLSSGALSAIFDGGFQEQSFHGPAYSAGPDAYFFLNGTFTGSFGRAATGSTDIGTVDFNIGVDSLSFNAARLGNGTPNFQVFGIDDLTLLTSSSITSDSNRVAASLFSFDSETLGGQIGSIRFDNAGPNANPPYGIAIDSFSASVSAIPEPSFAMVLLALVGGRLMRRCRSVN